MKETHTYLETQAIVAQEVFRALLTAGFERGEALWIITGIVANWLDEEDE